MKHNFTYCGPSIGSYAVTVYPSVSSTLSGAQSYTSVALACPKKF